MIFYEIVVDWNMKKLLVCLSLVLLISIPTYSQEKSYPEALYELLDRPDEYKLDKVIIDGKEYIGFIVKAQQFLVIDLGDGIQVSGSINTPSSRRKNYILEDNRSKRLIPYQFKEEKIRKTWVEAFPIINRKSIKKGFPIIIDDGSKIAPLSDPNGAPILMKTPMALINLFEAMGYDYIKADVRPTKSTPLNSSEIGKLAASIVLGFDINNYEENSIVYIFKRK